MAFPQTVLGTQVEMQINNAWTSVVRYDANTKILQDDGIKITRGASGLQDKTPPGTCNWTWQDPNGIYLNENPRSPYFNVLPRNTPVRVYVPRSSSALLITSQLGNVTNAGNQNNTVRCSCPDTVGNSTTGDMDIRIDIEPKRWTRWGERNTSTTTDGLTVLISKYGTPGNRGWHLRMRQDGALAFGWSTTGSNSAALTTTNTIDFSQPRLAIRCTMDVDNGAGQATATFYTAPTIAGPWTLFEAVTTTAGTTSIFDSTNPIEIGTIAQGDPSTALLHYYHFVGRVYAAEVYNTITGSGLIAQATFTGRANGTTSFADGLGNTWTVGTNAQITNADYRFHGEFSAPVLTPVKTKSGTGVVVKIAAEAGGILRRLDVNDTPLFSPLYRLMSSSQYAPLGYWTGEDSSQADTSTASSGISGVDPAVINDITFNGPDVTLAGSAGVMVMGSTAPSFVGTCKTGAQTTETHFVGLAKFPSIPAAETVLYQIRTANSTIVQWNWTVSNTAYTLRGYNAAGTEVATKQSAFGAGAEPDKWIAYHMQLTNSAGTVSIKSEWMEVSSGLTYSQTSIGTLSYAGSNGVPTSVTLNGTGLANVRVAHLNASNLAGLIFWDNSNPTFAKIARGYKGETADARFIRICQLLGVTPVIFGMLGDSEQMGAELLDTGLNNLYDCVNVSGGFMVEAPDQPATLEFYTLKSTYNQYGSTLSLTWAQLPEGIKATPDDTDIANDITLTRKNGGSARATQSFGPMSTQAPPNGINVVPDGPTINNYADSRLPFLVQQMLLIRSWPSPRYPEVTVNLEHPTFANNAALFLTAQRACQPQRMTITGLPTFMIPDNVELLIKSMTEIIKGQQWQIKWVCVPYGPYMGSELSTLTSNPYRFKAAHTTVSGVVQQQLNAGITAGATSFAVKTLSGVLFDTSATNVPVEIGGELMTVGSISGATSPQTFNSVTRGVNGYNAAHNANDAVIVYPTLKARL